VSHSLFIGVELTDKLQEGLDASKPAMEIYFKHDDPEYLLIRTIAGQKLIGRQVKSPLPCKDLDNLQRNVASLLKLIIPNVRLNPDHICVFAQPEVQIETSI
jgi:hypothetical protein